MALRFIGIDPDTGTANSPTVWVDEVRRAFVFQGWKASPELESECASVEIPGHAVGIPDDEGVFLIPFRMVQMIREACDVAEQAERAKL